MDYKKLFYVFSTLMVLGEEVLSVLAKRVREGLHRGFGWQQVSQQGHFKLHMPAVRTKR